MELDILNSSCEVDDDGFVIWSHLIKKLDFKEDEFYNKVSVTKNIDNFFDNYREIIKGFLKKLPTFSKEKIENYKITTDDGSTRGSSFLDGISFIKSLPHFHSLYDKFVMGNKMAYYFVEIYQMNITHLAKTVHLTISLIESDEKGFYREKGCNICMFVVNDLTFIDDLSEVLYVSF